MEVGDEDAWRFLLFDNDVFPHSPLYPVGTRQRSSLRHYVTSRKVAGSSRGEVNFLIYIIFPAALWPGDRLSL
jgi:hypothetical protein